MDEPEDHWTPGPWHARWGFLDDDYGGEYVWSIESETSGYANSLGRTQVCTVGGEDSQRELPTDWVSEADARLIAHGPIMASAIMNHASDHGAPGGCYLCVLADQLHQIRRPLIETNPELFPMGRPPD